MSNKILIPLIVVLSLITVGVASLTQLNKPSEKVAVVTSPAIESSVKSQVTVSSTIQTNSSVGVSSAQTSSAQKVEESKSQDNIKVESKTPAQVNSKCNLPESENLVKTEDGCFNLGISVNTFSTTSEDIYHPKYSDELKNVIILAAKDYYSKSKSTVVTKEAVLNIGGTQKISETSFKLYISIGDPDYLRSQGYNMQSDRTRFNGIYDLNFVNNKWQINFNKDSVI